MGYDVYSYQQKARRKMTIFLSDDELEVLRDEALDVLIDEGVEVLEYDECFYFGFPVSQAYYTAAAENVIDDVPAMLELCGFGSVADFKKYYRSLR